MTFKKNGAPMEIVAKRTFGGLYDTNNLSYITLTDFSKLIELQFVEIDCENNIAIFNLSVFNLYTIFSLIQFVSHFVN